MTFMIKNKIYYIWNNNLAGCCDKSRKTIIVNKQIFAYSIFFLKLSVFKQLLSFHHQNLLNNNFKVINGSFSIKIIPTQTHFHLSKNIYFSMVSMSKDWERWIHFNNIHKPDIFIYFCLWFFFRNQTMRKICNIFLIV